MLLSEFFSQSWKSASTPNNLKAAGRVSSPLSSSNSYQKKNTKVPHWLNATFDKSLPHMGFFLWFMLLNERRIPSTNCWCSLIQYSVLHPETQLFVSTRLHVHTFWKEFVLLLRLDMKYSHWHRSECCGEMMPAPMMFDRNETLNETFTVMEENDDLAVSPSRLFTLKVTFSVGVRVKNLQLVSKC